MAIICRVGKGASRRAGLLARPIMRLCPRCPTLPPDRVGKGTRGQRAMSSAVTGDFAPPTTLPTRPHAPRGPGWLDGYRTVDCVDPIHTTTFRPAWRAHRP